MNLVAISAIPCSRPMVIDDLPVRNPMPASIPILLDTFFGSWGVAFIQNISPMEAIAVRNPAS